MYATRVRRQRYGAFLVLCCLSLTMTRCPAVAEEIYPRAAAVAAMQELAGAIEHVYRGFAPLLHGALPPGLRQNVESSLASIDTALTAYALADAHGARAQELAVARNDIQAAGAAIIARADNALSVGDYERCRNLVATLRQLANASNDNGLRIYVEEYDGILERRHGNPAGAATHQLKALELARNLGDETAQARALAHLGTIYRDQGDLAKAMDFQTQAMALGEKVDDRTDLTYRNLALLYGELDDNATSKQYFDKALVAAERCGDPRHYASVRGSYSTFLNDIGDHAGALAAASETLALVRVLNDRPAIAFEQLESGRALLGLKRLTEARDYLAAALEVGRTINQREIVGRSLLALAEIALATSDNAQARTLLNQAMSGLGSKHLKLQLAQAFGLREQIAEASGDYATALRYTRESAALREELLGAATNRRLAALQARDARIDADQKLAIATQANALQTALLDQQRLQRALGAALITGLALLLSVVFWRWLGMRRLNRALASRNVEIETKSAALSQANQRLQQHAEELYHVAITDPLTGVFNRGHLLRQLEVRIADCTRDGHEMALLLIDFDHFKRINDVRGHQFGDRVLVAGVQTMRQWLDPGDVLGRYGGEEFIIGMTGSDLVAARAFAERLREHVAETLAIVAPDPEAQATISIGIAVLSQLPQPARLEKLIEAADQAVYTAKAGGRNQVMNYVA